MTQPRCAGRPAGGRTFALPFGPVRSGVMESIELLLATPGENIERVTVHAHYKHRAVENRFVGLDACRGVLVAERVEGISSVAHALAFCHVLETIADVAVPDQAGLVRVIFAELERIANHLDVTMRLCDAAGLAVATARFGWHKEQVLRLVSRLCGSRLGRGVIVPGGVSASPHPDAFVADVLALRSRVRADVRALEASASFLDRLRGTGPLPAARACEHRALGPVGRASGFDEDARRARPYDGYARLPAVRAPAQDAGDALARARVRWHEIATSCELILAAAGRLAPDPPTRVALPAADGSAAGWAEAAQGEIRYRVELAGGVIRRCCARPASLHNMALFPEVFAGDIFTDLPFIEASFGLSYAGAAM